jgi:hypothetical protein
LLQVVELEAIGGQECWDVSVEMATASDSFPEGIDASLPVVNTGIGCASMFAEKECATGCEDAAHFLE